MEQMAVITIVVACGVWMAWYAYRFVKPRKGGGCAGGCCCEASKAKEDAPVAAASGQTVFFSADDLARRVKARKS